MGLIKIALKSTAVGSIVYFTVHEGLWSKSDESIKFYNKIHNIVTPYIKDNVPKEVVNEVPKLPSASDISYFFKFNWNKGVMVSMQFLVDLPSHTSNAFDSLMKQPAIAGLFDSSKITNGAEKKV